MIVLVVVVVTTVVVIVVVGVVVVVSVVVVVGVVVLVVVVAVLVAVAVAVVVVVVVTGVVGIVEVSLTLTTGKMHGGGYFAHDRCVCLITPVQQPLLPPGRFWQWYPPHVPQDLRQHTPAFFTPVQHATSMPCAG